MGTTCKGNAHTLYNERESWQSKSNKEFCHTNNFVNP